MACFPVFKRPPGQSLAQLHVFAEINAMVVLILGDATMGLLNLYQTRPGCVTLLKDIPEQRDLPTCQVRSRGNLKNKRVLQSPRFWPRVEAVNSEDVMEQVTARAKTTLVSDATVFAYNDVTYHRAPRLSTARCPQPFHPGDNPGANRKFLVNSRSNATPRRWHL